MDTIIRGLYKSRECHLHARKVLCSRYVLMCAQICVRRYVCADVCADMCCVFADMCVIKAM